MRILAILFFFLGSAAQAQTIEERLPLCIQQAEELLLEGTRIKNALATELDADDVNDILELMFAREIIDMFSELISRHIEDDATASELQNNLDKAVNPMGNRFDYISDMLVEHWDDKGISAKARYIAGCANNFDGKAEAQADVIANLKSENQELVEEQINYLAELEIKQRQYDELLLQQRDLKNKLYNFLTLYDQTKILMSLTTSTTFDRVNTIKESKLNNINLVENPDELKCVNILKSQGKLGDICAFKLASYLVENSSQ